jgi:hypothetical protein
MWESCCATIVRFAQSSAIREGRRGIPSWPTWIARFLVRGSVIGLAGEECGDRGGRRDDVAASAEVLERL